MHLGITLMRLHIVVSAQTRVRPNVAAKLPQTGMCSIHASHSHTGYIDKLSCHSSGVVQCFSEASELGRVVFRSMGVPDTHVWSMYPVDNDCCRSFCLDGLDWCFLVFDRGGFAGSS